MIKRSNIRRQTVELRPSRIRREPPAPVREKELRIHSEERELWTVAIGVVLFAIGLAIAIIGMSDITSH